MEGMNSEVGKIIKTYIGLALNRSLGSAILRSLPDKNVINIYSLWNIPDLIRSESTKFSQEYTLTYNSEKFKLLSQGLPCDISSVSKYSFTKSGNRYALLRKTKKNDESMFLEIWNSLQKESTFDMSDRREHGRIFDDGGEFQSFEWSSNEKYLLYIAEQKSKKFETFFKDIFNKNTEPKTTEEVAKGEEFLFRETWGESHMNAHHTVLCIFDIRTGQAEAINLDDSYPNISVAQASWGPNDDVIIFVGYEEAPSRLGLVYCSNRRSSIFSYNVSTKSVERLTSEDNVTIEYPVFSPNFETFVFLQNEAGGPHKSCRKLMKYDWLKKEVSTVIDLVQNPCDEEFAGIYITKLSSRWWSACSRFFFFHTFRRSYLDIFCVDIFSSKIQRIEVDKSSGACCLLDVRDPYILATVSSPNKQPCLMIGHFTNADDKIHVSWSSVNENSYHELQDISWNIHTLTPSRINETYSNLKYDLLTVSSKEEKNGTLMVFPHGGPHSVFYACYYDYVAAFARLGYIVCMVNYRGSIGFGENSIKSLPGNIGSQDVSDVVNAIEYLKKDEKLGIKNVVGFGGSHGGFLIAHLLGQYPDLLKAACVRNPVIDLTSMVGISDIPDWCWIESGLMKMYDPKESINPTHLREMWEKSPIRHIKKVKAPTLLCLGKKDLRVPPSQGLQFHRYLNVQSVPTKVYFYDDNHSLSKVGVSGDAFVHIARWFQTHLAVHDIYKEDFKQKLISDK